MTRRGSLALVLLVACSPVLLQQAVFAQAAGAARPQAPRPDAAGADRADVAAFPQPPAPTADKPPTRADILRGEYGRYRANNDLLFYHLDVRVDPEKKSISGKNTIRFRMLQDDTRIQLDLLRRPHRRPHPARDASRSSTSAISTPSSSIFPRRSRPAATTRIDFYYSGNPEGDRAASAAWPSRRIPTATPWINTACEGEGASVWWPNKDQWRDEVESMEISVVDSQRPGGRVEREVRRQDRSRRRLHALGLAGAVPDQQLRRLAQHRQLRALRRHARRPAARFLRRCPTISRKPSGSSRRPSRCSQAYEHYFGEYPFKKDGYKLIEAPYSGMEHQSAVTYGNHFANGYLERDWTGVGTSLKFDFIIIHESGHEWFGNGVSAADVSDMWIHEGWTTYLEGALRRAHVRARRGAEIHQRLQVQGPQPRADHHPARHPPRRRRRTCISRARSSSTRSAAS